MRAHVGVTIITASSVIRGVSASLTHVKAQVTPRLEGSPTTVAVNIWVPAEWNSYGPGGEIVIPSCAITVTVAVPVTLLSA
jgi:hypothetical protein